MYSDGATEFRKAMTNLFIPHTTSTPGRHETNALAERTVQSLSSAVRVLLEQSGLEHAFWPFAARFAAFAINTNVVDGASPWGRRHGENWMGYRFPFGCRVAMMPSLTSTKETPQLGPHVVPGICLGCNIQSGGVHHGEYFCITLEDVALYRQNPKHHIYIHVTRECFLEDPKAPICFPAYREVSVPPRRDIQPVGSGDGAASAEAEVDLPAPGASGSANPAPVPSDAPAPSPPVETPIPTQRSG